MTSSNLHGLARTGVSVWSDQISRSMLDSGELSLRVERDAVTGVTSNPSIFAGAIVGSSDYEEQLNDLRSSSLPTEDIVKELMADDIIRACDELAEVHARTEGKDGHVSVEVSPTLADDTGATISEARDWVRRIDRPNLLVKVPATRAGITAIRRLIGEGISVNVTLIFSLDRYGEVIDAYLEGLDDFHSKGGDVSKVASVASFFVSRFDSEVDGRLAAIATPEAMRLRGVTAVANARVAYGLFLHRFATTDFGLLAAQGARPQRPLWASTSTKNPDYHDLLYVEHLVASRTVNTMPLPTIDAYQDHGVANPEPFGPSDIERGRADLDRLGEVGIDYNEVVEKLESEGVEKFTASWVELLTSVESI